ncbi:MAG: sn-glycerol-3-phosphate ABC transporter ATP-binding protein UgpC [Phycisphaerales bacterium]|nr:MAG: sn-glycerol-3-phosphate ABC transporter ATP-binding protein UgpC [Phycisphaerales bacterium]
MAEVVLDRVRKVYPNGHEAVKEFNLRIPDGQFVVLVGPSGCGKSTTLRMVAGLEDITGGTVSIGGRVVNEVAPKDRDIAMVFQNYALYPHMSVYKNMAFALRLRRMPKDEIDRRINEAARMLGITELMDRKPRQLSGGQRQRVAVGRAIVREPKAFLFDEPLSNLDAKLRVTTRAELKALHQRLKTTTIYVTHDQEEAMTLGDIVVVMAGGVIQQAAGAFEVYQKPANRFVASFIGMPPMNFLEGTIDAAGDGLFFQEEGENGARLRLPEAWAARVADHAGEPLSLGVRPQAFEAPKDAEATARAEREGRAVRLRVGVVEPLGDQMDAYCTTPGGTAVICRVGAMSGLRAQEEAVFAVDTERAHLFAPGEFGENITIEKPEPVEAVGV